MRKILLITIFLVGFVKAQTQSIERVHASTSTEYIICWNGNNYIYTLFRFNHSNTSNGTNCLNHTYLWSSTDLDLGYNSDNDKKDKSLLFANECKSGKLKCVHKWKVQTGTDANNNPVYQNYEENAEVTIKIIPNTNPTITGTEIIDCGTSAEYTYTINNLCSHLTYNNINWYIPSGWTFKNPSDQYSSVKSVTLIADKYNTGEVRAYISLAQNFCFTETSLSLNISRPILNDITISNLNKTDIVAYQFIKIQNATSNPDITTKIKAGSSITINDGTRIYNSGTNFTQLAIGNVTSCSANKMALVSKPKDSVQIDSNAKALSSNLTKNELIIDIFPNPASEKVNIKLENLNSRNITILIYDLMGRLLKDNIISNVESESINIEMDINDLPAGSYIMNIKTDKENRQSKLIVEK